ncbi:hypothetical protein WJT86_04365 [Microvirga sp. W0021]|uniref:Lipoprotein n=1 Tax=Hohaiivirga grylli TaxID=3133970 RepID=A0ABV0BJ44_9HYPH
MTWTIRLTAVLALATMLSGCAQIGSALNRKDPVNTLNPTIPVGGSTSSKSNPLLIPPGYPQAAQPSK